MTHEWLQALILVTGFSYAVGVIFLPLLVQDILINAISDKWALRIWRCQYWPIINFLLFISIFVIILLMAFWFLVRTIMWNPIHREPYEKKYYKELYVPKKYKLPEKLKEKIK